jgi:uncharacterized protein YndB with AHSA1/START domain
MIHQEMSIHINCPPQQVFAFLVDPQKLMLWQSDLVKSEILTEGPLHAGSRFHEVRRLGPRETEIRGEISEFASDRLLATHTETKPEAGVRYVLEPEDGGTRLRYEFNLKTMGMMRLMEPMISRSVRHGTEADLQKLRQLMEG